MKIKLFTTLMISDAKPCEDGRYLVYTLDYIETMNYTVKYGWNTHGDSFEYAIPDDRIKAWARIDTGLIDKMLETSIDIGDILRYNLEKQEEG